MQNDYDDTTPFPDPVVIEITDVFDLHTIPPREVKAVVEEYLREAHALGLPVVRIIHGRGIGVQREIVQTILRKHPDVASFQDEPDRGSTLVKLGPPL